MIKYLKRYSFFLILAPLFMILEVAMDLLQPALMSRIIDEGVLGLSNNNVGNLSIIIKNGILMVGLVGIGALAGFLCGVFANIASQRLSNDMRKDCFKTIMNLSFEQTDQFTTGSLITRVTNDITQIQNMITQTVRGGIRSAMFLIGGSFCLIQLNVKFSIVVLCILPIIFGVIIFVMFKGNPMFDKLQRSLDNINVVMQENVAGNRVVKAYVKEEHEKSRFEESNEKLVGNQLKVLLLFSYMTPIINIALNIGVVCIIYIGSFEVQAGNITPGKVMAAITYISLILNGVMTVVMVLQTISRGLASYRRVNEVLTSVPTIIDGDGETSAQNNKEESIKKGNIEFKNVSFSYNGEEKDYVLRDINLTVKSGETLGILGETGSGKSSLVHLIPRFYEATKGQIFVDDIDVKEYKVADLREKISIALQRSELFSKSIEENIRWGKKDASKQKIKEVTKIAQADGFINKTSDGYETLVAERGMNLSGGQKQRIAISRAILKNSEILIFDDSTSALDFKTESDLYKKLNKSYGDITKIIIAQRVASVQGADRIVVLDNGKIVGCDSHENLLQSCKVYQDIYNSQIKNGGSINE